MEEGAVPSGLTRQTSTRCFMTDEHVREVFTRVALGEGRHGSFLVKFSEALIRADYKNFQLLKPIAENFIQEYGLK
jgi:hypothetical protein